MASVEVRIQVDFAVLKLPWDDFEPVNFKLVWHGKLKPALTAFVQAVEEAAWSLWGGSLLPAEKQR